MTNEQRQRLENYSKEWFKAPSLTPLEDGKHTATLIGFKYDLDNFYLELQLKLSDRTITPRYNIVITADGKIINNADRAVYEIRTQLGTKENFANKKDFLTSLKDKSIDVWVTRESNKEMTRKFMVVSFVEPQAYQASAPTATPASADDSCPE